MGEHAQQPIAASRRETVFGLHRLGKPRLVELLATEPLKLANVSESALQADDISPETTTPTHRRRLQWLEGQNESPEPFILSESLHATMNAWRWPLHFIDFQTSRAALPFQAKRTPYDQILFQFSNHRLTADGRLEHGTQCIEATPGSESSIAVLRALRKALSSDAGTVLHWFPHERTVLKDVRAQLLLDPPADSVELVRFVDSLLGDPAVPGRLADLGLLVHRCIFYPGTGGSSSIKRVLPAALKSSAALRARMRMRKNPISSKTGAPRSLPTISCSGTIYRCRSARGSRRSFLGIANSTRWRWSWVYQALIGHGLP